MGTAGRPSTAAPHTALQHGQGIITTTELKELVAKVGGELSETDAAALITVADKDNSSGIDFSEFAKLWEALHGEGEDKIRAEFAKLDTDASGFITKEEMLVVISAGFDGVKVDEAKAAIDKLDVDKDGKVSYPEFLMVMKYKK